MTHARFYITKSPSIARLSNGILWVNDFQPTEAENGDI